jgi:two-component system cell cycle response regulator
VIFIVLELNSGVQMEILYLSDKYPPFLTGSEMDWSLTHCNTREAALDILNKVDIDLVFITTTLKDSPGIDFISTLSQGSFYSIPIVYIYTKKDEVPNTRRFSLGLVDYISQEEFTPGRVIAYLNRNIEQQKLIEGIKELSIAIIDDSKVSIKVIASILEEIGVDKYKSYMDPRDLIMSGETFDVYFIDMVMPGITGDKLVSMMRGQSPNSIIITMSSIDNVKTISNVLSSGSDDYIIKPFNKDVLIARLKTNFRSYNLLRELEVKNRELDRLSKTDSLTGALNHGYIFKKLSRAIEKSTFQGSPLALAIIDLDFFKEVNDNYGHVAGDNVLVAITDLFKKRLPKEAAFGRYGGEEFLAILPYDQKSSFSILDGIREEFFDLRFKGVDRSLSFSGGLALWRGESESDLVKIADSLLYEAKKSGRNNIKS